MIARLTAALAALLLAAPLAYAVPQGLSVQARLETSGGSPVSGTHDVTLRLFATQGATNPLWTGVFDDVAVQGGLLDLTLGADAAAALAVSPGAWLEAQVGAEAPLPRQPVLSVAYALRADSAAKADVATAGVSCTGCLPGAALAPGAVGAGQLATGAVTSVHANFNYAKSNAVAGAATDLECTGCVGSGDLAAGLQLAGNVSVEGGVTACTAGAPGCAVVLGAAGSLTDEGDGAVTVRSAAGLQVRGEAGDTWGPIEAADGVLHGTLTVTTLDCDGCVGPAALAEGVASVWGREEDGTIHYQGGNVGVATSAPTAELEVAGTVKAERFEGALGSAAGDVDIALIVALLRSKNVDLDGDGVPNADEAHVDSDGDGEPDMFDPDADNDGIGDGDDGDPTDPGVYYKPVTGFTATPDPADPATIQLAWTKSKSSGVTRTVVRRKAGSAPSSPSDGVAIADTAGASATDPVLPPGVYFYAAFAGDAAGIFSPAAVAGPVTLDLIHPVTDVQLLGSANGQVQIGWAPSDTPGFAHTRIVRKMGGWPTGISDGVVVATTGAGVATLTDTDLVPWQTWHYVLFATNAVESDFSAGVQLGTAGTFVHGTKACPPGQVLVGLDAQDEVLCAAPQVDYSLDCETVSAGGGASGTPVTAACASGYSVTGGGFSDIDQDGGGTTGDNFASQASGNGWRVTFNDEAGTFTCYARCCRVTTASTVPAQAGGCPANQMVVSLTGTSGPDHGMTCGSFAAPGELSCTTVNQSGGVKNTPVTAACPADREVTGGGFIDVDQDGNGSGGDDFSSIPSGNGWHVRFDDEGGSNFSATARCCKATLGGAGGAGHCAAGQVAVGVASKPSGGYALTCAAPGGGTPALQCQVVSVTGGANGNPVTAVCPTGKVLTGGGFYDIDQDGAGGGGDNFHSRPSGNGWYTRFEDEAGSFHSRAVCCDVVE